MKLLYIAAPYTANTHSETAQNIIVARIMAERYWMKGYAVICPHMNTAFMSGLVPEYVFYEGTIEMLKRCDVVAFHPDWKKSSGCKVEYRVAKELNKEIIYYE